MNVLKATKRVSASTGQINKLRSSGSIPGVLYGGKKDNLNISLKKLHLQDLIKAGTFMSKVVDLEIDGSSEKVLPRDVAYDPVSDEPIHIDFMRIVKGSRLTLDIPVKFINSDKSPGLKKGGVLNIVRRKVELKCPIENIPDEIVVDLNNTEINTSLKISSVKLPANVVPTRVAKVCNLALKNNSEQAKIIDLELRALHKVLFIESSPIPVKWVLNRMGKIPEGIRLPLSWLSSSYYEEIELILKKLRLI